MLEWWLIGRMEITAGVAMQALLESDHTRPMNSHTALLQISS